MRGANQWPCNCGDGGAPYCSYPDHCPPYSLVLSHKNLVLKLSSMYLIVLMFSDAPRTPRTSARATRGATMSTLRSSSARSPTPNASSSTRLIRERVCVYSPCYSSAIQIALFNPLISLRGSVIIRCILIFLRQPPESKEVFPFPGSFLGPETRASFCTATYYHQ